MNTFGHKLEIFCQRDAWHQGIKFWFKDTTWSPEGTRIAVADKLSLRTLTEKDHGFEVEPTFTFRDEQAQQFMDELWRVGLRPTEGTGSAGSLAATERHLADMRALVFKITPKIDGA